jgi:hypothetical protein
MSHRWTRGFLWLACLSSIAVGIAILAISSVLPASMRESATVIGAALIVPAPIILGVLAGLAEVFERR